VEVLALIEGELQQNVDELEKQQEQAKQEDLQKQIDDLEAEQEEQ
jgi:hypothetical protein